MNLNQELKLPPIDLRNIKFSEIYKNKYFIFGSLGFITLIMLVIILLTPSSMKRTNQTSLSYNQAGQNSSFSSSVSSLTPAVLANPTASSTPTISIPTITPSPTTKPTPTLIPTAIPTVTPDPFAGWKIYQNVQYGYIVRYPSDWIILDRGILEPKVPSYIVFNQNTASSSARYISISASTRTYDEQLAIGGAGTPITVANINAITQFFQDSNGQQSTAVVIPRTNYLIILRSKTPYLTIFNKMLASLQLTK